MVFMCAVLWSCGTLWIVENHQYNGYYCKMLCNTSILKYEVFCIIKLEYFYAEMMGCLDDVIDF